MGEELTKNLEDYINLASENYAKKIMYLGGTVLSSLYCAAGIYLYSLTADRNDVSSEIAKYYSIIMGITMPYCIWKGIKSSKEYKKNLKSVKELEEELIKIIIKCD